MIRLLTGLCLLAAPFGLVIGFGIAALGPLNTAIALSITAAALGCIFGGLHILGGASRR